MEQYIRKSAVIAEIERLKDQLLYGACSSQISMQTRCKEEAYNEVLSFLDTLEVKEVDLEKEIKEQIDKYYEICNKKLEEMGEDDNDISFLTLDGFAKHFFELGLKAKGE